MIADSDLPVPAPALPAGVVLLQYADDLLFGVRKMIKTLF